MAENLSLSSFKAAPQNVVGEASRRFGLLTRAVLPCAALLCLVAPLFASAIAGAVLLSTGNARGNVTPPEDDPGFRNVGTRARNGMTIIYLGDGWVLTANHVGAEDVRLGGIVYRAVEGSGRRMVNENSTLTDLLLYRIAGNPVLPTLPRLRLARETPRVGEPVWMMGHGADRGNAILREIDGEQQVQGWEWRSRSSLRWGTNRVARAGEFVTMRKTTTRALSTAFDQKPNATRYEAQAARGDSGGAMFARARRPDESGRGPDDGNTGEWELVGVMFAVSSMLGRKDDVSVFGSSTHAADVAYYRDQILSIIKQAEPRQPRDPQGGSALDASLGESR